LQLVLYTFYNEMLGEFYDRSLPFLWMISKEHEWVRHSQLYLHMYMPNRRLMDSHHLFTNPFRTMPLLDFATLMDETSCQCLPRLIFCGYDVVPKSSKRRRKRSKSAELMAGGASNASPSTTNVAVELKPGQLLTEIPNRKMHQLFHRDLRKALVSDNPHITDDVQSFRDSVLDEADEASRVEESGKGHGGRVPGIVRSQDPPCGSERGG
jgi:hypothetical protein